MVDFKEKPTTSSPVTGDGEMQGEDEALLFSSSRTSPSSEPDAVAGSPIAPTGPVTPCFVFYDACIRIITELAISG